MPVIVLTMQSVLIFKGEKLDMEKVKDLLFMLRHTDNLQVIMTSLGSCFGTLPLPLSTLCIWKLRHITLPMSDHLELL